jgi:hypothetical protein
MHIAPMAQRRRCNCGAVYERTEEIVDVRERSDFQCLLCREVIESWHSASVPKYRFIAGPAQAAK